MIKIREQEKKYHSLKSEIHTFKQILNHLNIYSQQPLDEW